MLNPGKTEGAEGRSGRWLRKTAAGLAMGLLLPTMHPSRCGGQDKPDAPVLTVDQVVEAMVKMNRSRAEALRHYTSVREYHLTLEGIFHKRADIVAKMTYVWPDRKEFQIISESGSELMRNRVLKATMEVEREGLRNENRERTALTPANYEFALDKVEGSPPAFYVLTATPKISNKFVFKGKIWVDAQDFAVARFDCEPAKNPSWWLKKNDITYTYQKLGDFWLPAHMQTVTEVRIFGRSVLTVDYKDYNLIEARKLQTASPEAEAARPHTGLNTAPAP